VFHYLPGGKAKCDYFRKKQKGGTPRGGDGEYFLIGGETKLKGGRVDNSKKRRRGESTSDRRGVN